MNKLDIPKNIRQIGKGQSSPKIYVEDYVITYAKQLYRQSNHGETAGVLLGTDTYEDNERYIFIWGLMELPGFHGITEGRLSNEIWSRIYTEVKENFSEVDIIGWFYCCDDTPLECSEAIHRMHAENFADGDRLLMLHDSDTRESAFFIQQMERMEKQEGYYIFYKRNDEMYTYMDRHKKPITRQKAEESKPVMDEIPYEDEPVAEKLPEKKGTSKLGIVIAVAAVLFVLVALQNQNGFEGIKTSLNHVRERISGTTKGTEEETVTVETLAGNVTKAAVSTVAPVSGPAAQPSQPTSEPSVTPSETPVKKQRVRNKQATPTPKPIQIAYTEYTVKKGDTLSSISEKFYHNAYYVSRIQEYNHLKKNEMIHIGQELRLPKSV